MPRGYVADVSRKECYICSNCCVPLFRNRACRGAVVWHAQNKLRTRYDIPSAELKDVRACEPRDTKEERGRRKDIT